jgi:hypothetical protein
MARVRGYARDRVIPLRVSRIEVALARALTLGLCSCEVARGRGNTRVGENRESPRVIGACVPVCVVVRIPKVRCRSIGGYAKSVLTNEWF